MTTKKNLPNIPIYIGDWERDCNVLSLESEAAWMRIVFKLWTKGKQNSIKMPAKSLQNLWRCGPDKMIDILNELEYNEICEIFNDEKGFITFTCRRFVKENELSKTRSKAAKGHREEKKEEQTQSKLKAKHKQITEIDNENESDNESNFEIEKNKGDERILIEASFESWWDLYDKKIDLKKCMAKWNKMKWEERKAAHLHTKKYVEATPDKQYRRNPTTYLNNQNWNDLELLEKRSTNDKPKDTRQTVDQIFDDIYAGTDNQQNRIE